MCKHKQEQLRQLNVLKYFIIRLRKTRTDWRFMTILLYDVIPIIKCIAPGLVVNWLQDIETYKCMNKLLADNAHKEVKDALCKIKLDILESDIKAYPEIAVQITKVEQILEGKSEDVTFDLNQIRPLHWEFYRLCEKLVSAYVFWYAVKDFCIIGFRNEYGTDQDSKYVIYQQPYIKHYLIGSFLEEYLNAQYALISILDATGQYGPRPYSEMVDRLSPKEAWTCWEYLHRFVWSNQISRDFFRKKGLKYKGLKERNRSIVLLPLHAIRCNTLAIKEKRQKGYSKSIFNRNLVRISLDRVFDEIKKHFDLVDVDVVDNIQPVSMELALEDDLLLHLKLKWAEGVVQVYRLHRFQDDEDNVIYDFFSSLLTKGSAEINCGSVTGGNVLKYVDKVGLRFAIDIFFDEINAYRARLKNTIIDLRSLPEARVKKLLRQVRDLKKHWQ